ncbi:MAG TPA: hypothetical protein VHM69_04180 [Rubrobacter sp.]|nr:hypothetical protein [Rubrobacter sp.]
MLVVVARRSDQKARDLAERWANYGGAVLTCDDLSVAGWRQLLGGHETSMVVIDGQVVEARRIAGVLMLLPYVTEGELVRIAREDRRYVASEMTAFLHFWLSGLPCPVLNRPTPVCLTGPGWRREQWVYVAARLGIPVEAVAWRLDRAAGVPEKKNSSAPGITVTMVGSRCLGSADGTLVSYVRRLSRAAGVEMLSVDFRETETGFRLYNARSSWADISSPEVADAILEYFLARSAGC